MEGLQRLLVALGVDESRTVGEKGDLLSFLDRIRNTIRDNKNQANGLIDIHILREFITAITTTEEPNGSNDEIVEMVLRCMINALCDNETATTILILELHGISVVVTLLHRTKTSSIAYQITKLIYMLISQFEKIAMSSLLSWRLANTVPTLPSNDPSTTVGHSAPTMIADVLITHLEQCQINQIAIDIHSPPPPPPLTSGQTHLHSSSRDEDGPVHCSGECTLHPAASLPLPLI